VPFPGIVLAWGRQNRGREQSLDPVNSLLAFCFFSALALPACKDDANHPKVSTNVTYSDSKVAVSRGGVEQAFMPAVKRHRKYRLQPLR
jgi:hypothetical protein